MAVKQQILVSDNKYDGKYVALKSFCDKTVITSGDDPSEVLADARRKGSKTPVIVFINKADMAYIY